jgi:hypothetical protein
VLVELLANRKRASLVYSYRHYCPLFARLGFANPSKPKWVWIAIGLQSKRFLDPRSKRANPQSGLEM